MVVQNLVACGLGVIVLPASALVAYRHPDVRVIDLAALGRRHIGVAHRRGAETVPATAALIAHIRAVAATTTEQR